MQKREGGQYKGREVGDEGAGGGRRGGGRREEGTPPQLKQWRTWPTTHLAIQYNTTLFIHIGIIQKTGGGIHTYFLSILWI